MTAAAPTKDQAADLIRRHSYPYSEADPRPCIHTRLGGIGADWMTQELLDTITRDGVRVEWAGFGFVGHDLVVVRPGETDLFVDVHRPDRADGCDRCQP